MLLLLLLLYTYHDFEYAVIKFQPETIFKLSSNFRIKNLFFSIFV